MIIKFKDSACANFKRLSKTSYYGLHQPDLQRVKTLGGDYNEHQLAIACDKPELIEQLVKEWQKLAYGRRTIIFAVNIQHSHNICIAFSKFGIPAAHVDGTTPIKHCGTEAEAG